MTLVLVQHFSCSYSSWASFFQCCINKLCNLINSILVLLRIWSAVITKWICCIQTHYLHYARWLIYKQSKKQTAQNLPHYHSLQQHFSIEKAIERGWLKSLVRVKKPISLHFNDNQIIWVTEEIFFADLASSVDSLFTNFLDSFNSFPWPNFGP